MSKSPARFAELLAAALLRAKAHTGRNVGALEDELGFAIQRGGAHYIQWLKKGNLPPEPADAVTLAHALTKWGGLDHEQAIRFLACAGVSTPADVLGSLSSSEAHMTDEKVATPAEPDAASAISEEDVFVAGPPITRPAQFFGRARELRRIFGWWRRSPMSHIAIIGPKRSGKTSLTHYLQRIHTAQPAALRPGQIQDWLPQPQRYRWVRVDFQDARMRKLDLLLKHWLTSLGLPVPEPCTLDHFMDIVKDEQRWRDPTLILMDDIDRGLVSPELSQGFWQSLRSLVDSSVEGNLAFLITSQVEPVRLADQQSKTSSFFTIFNTLLLGALTEDEARSLIAHAPHPFAEDDILWILAHSQCQPLPLQTLCQEKRVALEEGDATEAWRAEGLRRIAGLHV